jgi:UDP:flavonoid glycosyltransferase YjiC (YdhE family)
MRIVIIATGSWGDVRPNVVLGQALQNAGYTVMLVAAEEFRAWVEGHGLAFAGLSFNIQAMLDEQNNSSNLFQTMRWMRKVTQTTVQMGREITDLIQDGDAVLLNEGVLALVNGGLEKKSTRSSLTTAAWVPTADFRGWCRAAGLAAHSESNL